MNIYWLYGRPIFDFEGGGSVIGGGVGDRVTTSYRIVCVPNLYVLSGNESGSSGLFLVV